MKKKMKRGQVDMKSIIIAIVFILVSLISIFVGHGKGRVEILEPFCKYLGAEYISMDGIDYCVDRKNGSFEKVIFLNIENKKKGK